ncbi:MAG TPA: hypothetical protein VGL86_03235, partial [Polyangia bacterium]
PRELFDTTMPRIPIDRCASHYIVRGNDSGWFVAMRRGETLTFAPTVAGSTQWFEHYEDRTWIAAGARPESWGTAIAGTAVAPDRPARFTAPVTSFYRVTLHTAADPATPFDVCAAIDR